MDGRKEEAKTLAITNQLSKFNIQINIASILQHCT
jgi:hypothetical protein